MKRYLPIVCIALLLSLSVITPAGAQTDSASIQVNLSHSGTASQPRLVALPGGEIQVFWADRFDGVTTAVFDGQAWSDPKPAPLLTASPGQVPDVLLAFEGRVRAFWLEPETGEGMGSALRYSLVPFGRAAWTPPQTLARNVLAFDAQVTSAGLLVAYVQGQNLQNAPAGVYTRIQPAASFDFRPPRSVTTNLYFRALAAGQAYIQISGESPTGSIILNWPDPASGKPVVARATAPAENWSPAAVIEPPASAAAFLRPSLLAGDETALYLLWSIQQADGCAAYQQRIDPGADGWQAGPTQAAGALLPFCPRGDALWQYAGGYVWAWSSGTGRMAFMQQHAAGGGWSQPKEIHFTFTDRASGTTLTLVDLRSALVGDRLLVAGADTGRGDVWFTSTQLSALLQGAGDAAASPWQQAAQLPLGDAALRDMALALDTSGTAHLVVSQADEGGTGGTTIRYLKGSLGKSYRAIEIGKITETITEPHLAVVVERGAQAADDLLHVVWSGGENGTLMHTQCLASEAQSAAAWSAPNAITKQPGAVVLWPQLFAGAPHQLALLYAVPLNEGRGIYLLQSGDSGSSWSEPVTVFQAARAGWQMVAHPAFRIAPDGVYYAAWVRRPLPGMGQPEGIYVTCSRDGGQNWEPAVRLEEGGYDWPTLVASGGQMHIFYVQPAAGSLMQRYSADSQAQAGCTAGWSVAFNILKLAPAPDSPVLPYAVSASNDSIYLSAELPEGGRMAVRRLITAAPGASSWTDGESLAVADGNGGRVLAVEAGKQSLAPAAGRLAIAAAADDTNGEAPQHEVLVFARSVAVEQEITYAAAPPVQNPASSEPGAGPAADSAPVVTAPAETAATAAAQETQQPSPSRTPEYNQAPAAAGVPFPPPLIGVVVAAVSIASVFLFRGLRGRTRQ